MNYRLPPHALSGFLLSNSSTYRWSIGLPGWLIDLLIQKQTESWPISLIVGLAMLSPEYEREYCVKKMSVPTPDERQGYLDPVGLLLSAGFSCLGQGPEIIFETAEYKRLSNEEKKNLRRYIQSEGEWGKAQFQQKHLMDANEWMGAVYKKIKAAASAAYVVGALIAHDTFCMHSAFVRSFLLKRN